MWSKKLKNIYQLGTKELWSLWRDPIMLILILYTFTFSVYVSSTAIPETLNQAPIAIVDEDQSSLSRQITGAFIKPYFLSQTTELSTMDAGMDAGNFTFALVIPVGFQENVLAGNAASIQLNVDATRMSQAMSGSGYIQQIIMAEVNQYIQRHRQDTVLPVELELRTRFNPTRNTIWFGSIMQVINNITMLSIILTGAALIREKEHGTIEHLLVMPVTVFEIMMAKVWSMTLVVMCASFLSIKLVVETLLNVPIEGSLLLFFMGTLLSLFAMTSIGIYLATVSKSMPQFGLLMMLVMMPLQMLSGGSTPRESMPELVQHVMMIAPTTHFVELAQAILYRAAGLDVVWQPFLFLALIGALFFYVSLRHFGKTIHTMT